MDTIVVGIDVSKDKLDIAVRPSGAVFSLSRDAQGLDAVIARLAPLSPAAVAVEATGGFETVSRRPSRRPISKLLVKPSARVCSRQAA